ncbi:MULTISPECIES: uroporphyrinogen-III synthase [unclassified Helicobacter]|uniref:uroporphyrinogen-III synthase n=1 Tax=unclassified Helicobacter TaxID=2593540 RepID=UPI000CF0E7CC|nr:MULTISPECIES: uroporphyrinogen-III synthase [unclassified Helicobacter]
MREIILVNSRKHTEVKTLIVSEIAFVDMFDSLREIKGGFQALVFTSKNAIESLERNIQKYPQFAFLKKIPCYVIGQSSAKALEKYNFSVEYVGQDSHGFGFANEIIPALKKKRVLYFRAKKIVSGLDEILLNSGVKLKQIIAYENKRSSVDRTLKPPPKSILIFTSPSHYLSFIQNFSWDGSYIAIAIGMTTFGVFDTSIEAFVSPRQDIQSCIDFANEIAMRLA